MFRQVIKLLAQPGRVGVRSKRVLRYVHRFGVSCGLRTLFKILRSKGPPIRVTLPQSKTSIIFRPGTSDVSVFEQVFVWDDYALPFKLDPNLIIDGGANVGYASVYFANQYPEAQIVAVEPEKSNFELLLENTSGYPNVSTIQAGIWHKAATLKIENPNDDKSMFRTAESESQEGALRAVTIRELLARWNAPEIDILKLDIEGAEREVFSLNYEDWLGRVKLLIIELHDRYKPGCTASFYAAVSKFHFKEFQRGEHVILVRDQNCWETMHS